MAKVVLKNVSKKFDKVEAIKSVSLGVRDGEFFILAGPSGCGKSTVLRMIAGLEKVTEGEIYIDDKLVNEVPSKDRDISMVFQNYALYPHMSVYDNMAFALKLRKYSKEEIKQRVNEAAEILNIKEFLHRKPKQLSGGQKQRVAVGRAIVRKPRVFLFDEPLSNLDAKLRVQMRAELKKIHEALKTTVIYVTHDQIEAMSMGERICLLKDGVIQQIDKPLTVYDSPVNKFVAGFIGTPSMNFVKVEIERKDNKFIFINDNISINISQERYEKLKNYNKDYIILGIRPEHIHQKSSKEKDETSIIQAVVEVIEPMGSEILLYLQAGNDNLVAKMKPETNIKINDKFEFNINTEKLHLFDIETEKAL